MAFCDGWQYDGYEQISCLKMIRPRPPQLFHELTLDRPRSRLKQPNPVLGRHGIILHTLSRCFLFLSGCDMPTSTPLAPAFLLRYTLLPAQSRWVCKRRHKSQNRMWRCTESVVFLGLARRRTYIFNLPPPPRHSTPPHLHYVPQHYSPPPPPPHPCNHTQQP